MHFLEQRLRLPRGIAVLTTGGLAIVMLILLGSLVSSSIVRLSQNARQYQDRSRQLLERSVEMVPERLRDPLLEQLDLRVMLERTAGRVGSIIAGTTNAILGVLSQSFLVLVFVIFLLLGGGERPRSGLWREVEQRTQRYLLTKIALSAATGILVGTTLAILGVDLALVFGLLCFLLNFIPAVGSLIATALPIPVVAFMPEVSGLTILLAVAIPGAIQIGIGNFVEPRLMGDSLGLHPVALLLALIFWGTLWGVVGMLLAAPITSMAKILMERFPLTRPLAELMAGRLGAASA